MVAIDWTILLIFLFDIRGPNTDFGIVRNSIRKRATKYNYISFSDFFYIIWGEGLWFLLAHLCSKTHTSRMIETPAVNRRTFCCLIRRLLSYCRKKQYRPALQRRSNKVYSGQKTEAADGASVAKVGQKISKSTSTGASTGATVGDFVDPSSLGRNEGDTVGSPVGAKEIVGRGEMDGFPDGAAEGAGETVGAPLGAPVGLGVTYRSQPVDVASMQVGENESN